MIFSLKIDVFSGKIFPAMVNSTGTAAEEWSSHVRQLEAHFGRQVTSRLITDSAPYFESHQLSNFNRQRGIVHTPSPPYTQELNGLAERTIGTVLSMTRTSMVEAGAPKRAYGECMLSSCHVLDRCQHKQGGKLTRLEKWLGRLVPRQHERLRVWGCAAYVHLTYGKRGNIGEVGKLDARSQLAMLVGYDPNGMGYRVAMLPGFSVRTAIHVTFVESSFPCIATVGRELGSFMTPEQQQAADAGDAADAALDQLQSWGGRVSRRDRTLSAQALRNIAGRDPSPPEEADVHCATVDVDTTYHTSTGTSSSSPTRGCDDHDSAADDRDSPAPTRRQRHFAEKQRRQAVTAANAQRARARAARELILEHALFSEATFSFPTPKMHKPSDAERQFNECYAAYHDAVYAAYAGECPRSVPEALAGPESAKWRKSLAREHDQHEKNGTFGPAIDPKDLPPGRKPIPFDCILSEKRNGLPKTRGIVKGFHMTQGLDYNETFAPVPCLGVLRLMLAISAKFDWEVKQGDVHTAFLCADMDAEVYVAVPNWFCKDPTGKETGYTIRRMLKGVPGIPQGPRLFHKKSHGIYTKAGLTQCKSEFCLYYNAEKHIYLIVWVDDIFVFFPKEAEPSALKLWKELQQGFDLDDWEDIRDCLACTVTRDRANLTLTLSQEPAIRKLLQRLDITEVNEKDTPMVANAKLSKKDCPTTEEAAVMTDEQRWYRSTVASLIYFVGWTRPDMAYAVSKACRFMHNPGRVHIAALKRILRYLKMTAAKGLCYNFSAAAAAKAKEGVHGAYDASHADCPDTMRSTLAYVFFFFNCVISWHTKLHTLITTSTNHSEYCAAAKAAREAKWWEKVLTEIGFGRYVKPIDLFSDSKGAIAMTYNPVQRAASKHVDLADHYVREQQELGTITISYVNTKDMVADILTKPLGAPDFARHAAKLVQEVQL
jgi:hypothetical protein